MKKILSITINSAMNGYVVTCGCQMLVFETQERLLSELKRYLDEPVEVEREYSGKYGSTPTGYSGESIGGIGGGGLSAALRAPMEQGASREQVATERRKS